MIKVLIADYHQLFIDGLKAILVATLEIEVVGEAMNGQEVLDFCAENAVDIVIMDISMPVMDGIDATKQLVKTYPNLKTLCLCMHNDRNYIPDMLKTGAQGYILKNTG